jgi:hypothetical protein
MYHLVIEQSHHIQLLVSLLQCQRAFYIIVADEMTLFVFFPRGIRYTQKISATHVIKLGFAPNLYPPGQPMLSS